MLDTRIILSGLWVALMLIFLLGDVLRIFSGDFEAMGGMQDVTKGMFMGIAILMVIPIVMVVLSLTLQYPCLLYTSPSPRDRS